MSQIFGNHHGGGQLDHDTDGHLGIIFHAFAPQFSLGLSEPRLGLSHFLDARNHREHQRNIAVGRCSQNGAQLRLEQLRILQAETDGTQAHGRVCLVELAVGRDELIRSQVKGTENHLLGRHDGGKVDVLFSQFLFARQLGPIQVGVLGPVQSNPFATVVDDGRHLFHQLDIGQDLNAGAVKGLGRKLALAFDLAGIVLKKRSALVVVLKLCLIGIDHDLSGQPVNHNEVAVIDMIFELVHTYQGRNGQRAGHDTGVRGLAAANRGESHDLVDLQLHRIGGGQVMSHDDRPARQRLKIDLLADELDQHLVSNDANILHSLPNVGIINGTERGFLFGNSFFEGPCRIQAEVLDERLGSA